MKFFALSLCFSSALLSGCSTVATVIGDVTHNFDCDRNCRIPRVYSGVANDVCFIRGDAEDSVICLIDLPLSFVGDTGLLPYTAFRQGKFGDLCP